MKKTKSADPAPAANTIEDKKILRDRANALSRMPETETSGMDMLEVLEFRLAQESYAVETHYVSEVSPLKDLTPLPGTPGFMLGVVNVRGRITPVIDIKSFFELADKGLTDLHRVILVNGNDMEIGLLADVIVGVRAISIASLQTSLPTLTDIRSDYLKGVTAERMVVLDLDRILTDPRIIVHEEVEN
jgi:purine-binding chemotaxis protein CheW